MKEDKMPPGIMAKDAQPCGLELITLILHGSANLIKVFHQHYGSKKFPRPCTSTQNVTEMLPWTFP